MERFTCTFVSSNVISFILRDFTGKTAACKSCITLLVALFRAQQNNFLGLYKIWQGRQLFAKTVWTRCKYSLESLNFVSFTKPNKYKMRSEGFSTTWLNLFLNTFAIVREFWLLQSFVSIRFCATRSYRYTNPKHVVQRTLMLPFVSHTGFFTKKSTLIYAFSLRSKIVCSLWYNLLYL